MKKVLMVVVMLLLVTGCSSNRIEKLSYKELLKKFEAKESFILYFANEDSETLEKTLNRILNKYELDAYTINTTKLSQEEINNLRLNADYEEPSIVFVREGIDPSVITHVTDNYITEADLTTRLQDMKFIQ